MLPVKRILVATDFSDCSDAALDYGRELARLFHADLHVMHVVEMLAAPDVSGMGGYVAAVPALQADLDQSARAQLEKIVTPEDRRDVSAEIVVRTSDSPARAIGEYAGEAGIDLIVVGTHGRRGLSHLVMGSVAERIVRTAPCPVLTIRQFPRKPSATRASAGATAL
jgi:nucleotide-binding universal stress UspA family protein